MADEIVTLKVGISGATEAQIARLEQLDKVVESLKKKSNISVNITSLPQGMGNAEESAKAAAKYINAQANMIKAQNQLAVEQERTRQAIAGQATQEIKAQAAADGLIRTQRTYNQLWDVLGRRIMNAFAQNIQKATAELKAMNAEMVSIQKVTGATDAEMERLKNSAFEVSGALGTTPSDYLSSVTKWAQAGYGALSDQLGELSAKTQVVGDVNEETANKFLLAVDAAYKYKGNIDSLTKVLDGANEISNNYATSVDKLANGMGIVSSLAEQAGMKVEETMAAIGTITAKTQESGNSAARALRALILNIQGSTEIEIDTETGERWSEDEIQRTAAALGELNVATREYKDGVMSLRNPMEVIGELAEKYRKGLVTEAQLQEVVASLGGKVRSNQLMALIQGFDTYQQMIETYKDSVGSADKELEIYLNGWEAKSNRLVAQWTQFVENFKASDISMGLLDVGNLFLKLANTDLGNAAAQIAAITAAITALKAAAAGEKVFPALVSKFVEIPRGLKGIADDVKKAAGEYTGLKAAMAGAGKGAQSFVASLYSAVGPVGIALIAITALSAAYDAFGRDAAKAADALAEAKGEYEQSSAQLESLQDELKTTQDRIDELNAKDSLTVVEQEELDKLSRENADLERQIGIQKQLNKAKKEALDLAAQKALDAGYAGADKTFFERLFADYSKPENFIALNLNGKDFAESAQWLGDALDNLNAKKEKFLADHPNASAWSKKEQKQFQDLEEELSTYQLYAINFYDTLNSNAQNLSDSSVREYWDGVGETLYASMFPAEALTERFNRLVDAMDEAEHTRFTETLERIQKDGKVTAEEVQSLIDRFPVLKQGLELNGATAGTLAQYLTELAARAEDGADGLKELEDSGKGAQASIEDLAKTLKDCVSRIEGVESAQEELKKNGSLSTNTLIGLLGKYEEAIDEVLLKALAGVATQEEVSEALQKAYEADANAYRDAVLAKNMDSEDFYTSWLSQNVTTVNTLLKNYGIDANNFKTFSELKQAITAAEQTAETSMTQQGGNDRKNIFSDIESFFAQTQDAMALRAQSTTGFISSLYSGIAGLMGSMADAMSAPSGVFGNVLSSVRSGLQQLKTLTGGWNLVTGTIPVYTSGSKGSGYKGGSGSSSAAAKSTKDWYEEQIDNLKKLEESTKRTNQVLEQSDQDTSEQRIKNLKGLQDRVLAMEKEFIKKGKAADSDEVNQLKIIYAGLADDIRDIYASLSDGLLASHKDAVWLFELKDNNSRTMEQIAADDAAMIQEYRKMQYDTHALAEYFRSQGIRENDELIRNLQDAWWDYETSIRTIYQNLTDAFDSYIDESSHKIEELGRTTGTVGQQIEIYAQRIAKAQETIAALQANNIDGSLNGDIQNIESQIWSDQDAIRDLQEGLWQELEDAFDDIFDKAKEKVDDIGAEIDAIQEEMDGINEILARYDKELEGILKPINATLDALNDQLEAERKRLEAQTAPLNAQKDALSEQISGYYTVNPDGSIGPYVKGLDDHIDEINDQIDKVREELDQVNDAWDEQKRQEDEALALQKKQLAVEEAQKAVQDAMLALQTARNERNVYTLKDGVWAWRADEEAVAKAEEALADAEKAKEEAERDLQDYKEEQAHKQIVKRLEEQIRALEEQKKLLDRQKNLIQKQIDALSKQIDAFEKESQARQDFIQDLIDRKEEEKEAWEDHYAALKDQYSQQLDALEEQKKAAEARRKEAEKEYDQWMDTWEDIRKSIETPARDIQDILNDISKYGTPAMAAQVDRVTGLLRQLGYVLEETTPGVSGGDSRRDIIDRMLANTLRMQQTQDQDEKIRLFEENQRLGGMIGASFNPASGQWDIFDYSGGTITVRPGAYEENWSDGGILGEPPLETQAGIIPLSLDQLENDAWARYKAEHGILTGEDHSAAQNAYSGIQAAYDASPSYVDNHSITMNGVTIGSSMMQRPLSDTLRLISLNMGT